MSLIDVPFIGISQGMPLIGVPLIGVHLTGVPLIDVSLIGVHLTGRSDLVGLDWSWIRVSLQSNPEQMP